MFLIGFVRSRVVVSIVSVLLCGVSMACWVSALFANQERVSASFTCIDIFSGIPDKVIRMFYMC